MVLGHGARRIGTRCSSSHLLQRVASRRINRPDGFASCGASMALSSSVHGASAIAGAISSATSSGSGTVSAARRPTRLPPATGAPGRPVNKVSPPRLLVQPLPPFEDDRLPGPEPQVSAFLLRKAIDLRHLRQQLVELGCPTVMWQSEVLVCGSCAGIGQQRCNAVFLPDGVVVCWNMSSATERRVLSLAAGSPAERRGHRPWAEDADSGVRMDERRVPVATERLDIADAPDGVVTVLDAQDGTLRLTRDIMARTSHQLGLSLGLAVAVRLDALERCIEAKLEADWRDMHEEVRRTLNLGAVSHRIFVAERGLHELRYALNSEAGVLDAPDLLWEHALAERLYDQVVAHFDVRRRTALLNERLSYSLDYLHTLGEYVRHQYSVRLEGAIILIIFLELCLGVMSYTHDHSCEDGGAGTGAFRATIATAISTLGMTRTTKSE